MTTVIYADILIIVNMIVNYFLLRAAAKITSLEFKSYRILLSSFCGGLFSLIIFIDEIPLFLNFIIKILFMSFMVIIAFKIASFKAFLKYFLAFFAANFIFSGIMLAVNIFIAPNASVYNNGIIYFDINIFTLTLFSVGCYLILTIINRIIKSRTPPKSIYQIRIKYEDKIAECSALFDSGNTLCDCFSGKPVIIAERSFLKNLIDERKIETLKNYRIIPFSTISSNGALPSFMADSVGIFVSGKWFFAENIYIGITEKKIVSGGFSALIGAPYFDLISDKINYNGG